MGENFNFPRNYPHASTSDDVLYQSSQHRSSPTPPPSQTDQMRKMAGVALGTGSIWGFEIISHPFIVIRRSCQIYCPSQRLHLTPVTLMPIMVSLNKNKPVISMWKGFVSNLCARGINMISENVINETTNWPLQVSSYSTLKKHFLHLLLKGVGFIITAPFYVSSFVESVQSDGANEPPTYFDFLLEGCNRFLGRGISYTTWTIPMWQLMVPTVTFRLCQYCIHSVAYYAVIRAKTEKREDSHHDSSTTDSNTNTAVSLYDEQFPALLAMFTGTFLADLVLYPMETVLHRLYIQGTRVLIDNTDSGLEVAPIGTQYAGVIDCFRSIVVDEGVLGLYRGFGAFILQFTLHAAGLKMVQYLFEKISSELSPSGSHSSSRTSTPLPSSRTSTPYSSQNTTPKRRSRNF